MSEFKIEKGSLEQKGIHANSLYPFWEMAVGDSFFIPGAKTNDKAYRAAINAAINYGKRWQAKFKIRTFSDGIRVWRIA